MPTPTDAVINQPNVDKTPEAYEKIILNDATMSTQTKIKLLFRFSLIHMHTNSSDVKTWDAMAKKYYMMDACSTEVGDTLIPFGWTLSIPSILLIITLGALGGLIFAIPIFIALGFLVFSEAND